MINNINEDEEKTNGSIAQNKKDQTLFTKTAKCDMTRSQTKLTFGDSGLYLVLEWVFCLISTRSNVDQSVQYQSCDALFEQLKRLILSRLYV